MHTLGEGNFCADFLAKEAYCINKELMVLDNPPTALLQMLEADAYGVSFPSHF
ncbi:hypothetical protein PTKIN_Ptkin15bG0057900 [Pterospermum kingtungense]